MTTDDIYDITTDSTINDMRVLGLTVTQDVNPGFLLTFDDGVHRVFAGTRVTCTSPGQYSLGATPDGP